MSLRVALALIATSLWTSVLIYAAEAFLSPRSAILAAMFIGAAAAFVGCQCADYDHSHRSQRNRP